MSSDSEKKSVTTPSSPPSDTAAPTRGPILSSIDGMLARLKFPVLKLPVLKHAYLPQRIKIPLLPQRAFALKLDFDKYYKPVAEYPLLSSQENTQLKESLLHMASAREKESLLHTASARAIVDSIFHKKTGKVFDQDIFNFEEKFDPEKYQEQPAKFYSVYTDLLTAKYKNTAENSPESKVLSALESELAYYRVIKEQITTTSLMNGLTTPPQQGLNQEEKNELSLADQVLSNKDLVGLIAKHLDVKTLAHLIVTTKRLRTAADTPAIRGRLIRVREHLGIFNVRLSSCTRPAQPQFQYDSKADQGQPNPVTCPSDLKKAMEKDAPGQAELHADIGTGFVIIPN